MKTYGIMCYILFEFYFVEGKLKKGKNVYKYKVKGKISGALRALLVSILVLIQFGFIFMLSLSMQLFSVYFYLILEICSLIVILGLVNDDRSPSYKVAWISIVLLLPLSGHVMYALWGNETSNKKCPHCLCAADTAAGGLSDLLWLALWNGGMVFCGERKRPFPDLRGTG